MSVRLVSAVDRAAWIDRFRRVRQASVEMCRPLAAEDYRLQPMEDVSPPWWNLGHTSWFFVRNLLEPFGGARQPEDAQYDFVLNSYYTALGPRLARDRRGLISRPTTEEIYRYQSSVDRRVEDLLRSLDEDRLEDAAFVLTVGLNHEQQHQELFYTEIKFILAENPPTLRRPYRHAPGESAPGEAARSRFLEFDGGLLEFGNLEGGWCWDNELPVHKFHLEPFALQDRLVTNAEYLEFVDDGGYSQPLAWLDNGRACVEQQGWRAPLYWERHDGAWLQWTLGGMKPLVADEPVCHVSFYEADAFARWRSQAYSDRPARLPSEREWEYAARRSAPGAAGGFLDSARLHPSARPGRAPLEQMAGVLWQWTASYYEPYPGYRPLPGALAEYNGKFMDNQRVLRGGSCVTPRDHYRTSYRNFWPGATRFQFTGIRLASDL